MVKQLLILFLFPLLAFADVDKDLEELQKQMGERLQQVEQLSKNLEGLEGAGQKALQIVNDPKLVGAIQKLAKHSNIKTLFVTQAVFFVLMLVFRAWRSSRYKSWVGRLWVSFYCTIISWVGLLVVLPLVLLGEPYKIILESLAKAIF